MFEALYLPVPEADLYLRRMRYDGPVRTERDVLDLLIRAHLQSVPFENIDIYDRRLPIPLGIPALFDKIVTRRRGGYCFELNGLFMALLSALGFSCYAVAAWRTAAWNWMPPAGRKRETACSAFRPAGVRPC